MNAMRRVLTTLLLAAASVDARSLSPSQKVAPVSHEGRAGRGREAAGLYASRGRGRGAMLDDRRSEQSRVLPPGDRDCDTYRGDDHDAADAICGFVSGACAAACHT